MANPKLKIEIGAESKDLKKGLKDAEKALDGFEQKAKKASTGTKSLDDNFGKIPDSVKNAANSMKGMVDGLGEMTGASTGTKSAIKALLSSFTSPAGLISVAGIAAGAMLTYAISLIDTRSEAEKLKDKQDALNKSLVDYKARLTEVQKASLKGTQDAVKELTKLELLKVQVEDVNLSQEKRVAAYNELKRIYPKTLENLTKEEALSGTVVDAYDDLTTAIIQKAKAQAASAKIAENSIRELELEGKLAEQQIESAKQLGIQKSNELDVSGQSLAVATLSLDAAAKAAKAKEASLVLEKGLADELLKTQMESAKLTKFIRDNGGIMPLSEKLPKTPKATKQKAASFSPTIDGAGIKAKLQKNIGDLDDFGSSLEKKIPSITGLYRKLYGEDESLNNDEFKIGLTQMEMDLIAFDEQAKDIIENGIANTFAGLGSAIGEALANGGNVMKAAGGALLSGLGTVLTQLGEMAIAAGVANLALFAALSGPPNPVSAALAIAAGVALVAIGSAVGSLNKSVKSGGTGGGSYGGSSSSGGSNYSSGSGSVSSGGFQNVVFEIAGTKLVGVISNTLDRNKALSGNLSIT